MVMPFFLGPRPPRVRPSPLRPLNAWGRPKPLLHNSRPAVGNLRATHRALILLLLAPNHNRLCWVVILFLVQTYSYCTFFAAAVYVGAKSPLRPRLFISAAKKTTPHDPLFLLSQPQPLTLGCGQGRPRGLINDRTPPPWGGVRSSHFSRARDLTLTPRTS